MSVARTAATLILAITFVTTICAPMLAPLDPAEQHVDFPYAPPLRPRLIDRYGGWHMPFVYPVRLSNRLMRDYVEDSARAIPIWQPWSSGSVESGMVFLLGTDGLGRDLLSRLLVGARWSLGLAAAATILALAIGTLVGAVAGYADGLFDEIGMRVAELVVVLPTLYVLLAVRGALPLVLEPQQVFAGATIALGLLGWPAIARGVRAICAVEARLDYVEAARAAGASHARVLFRHILPAAGGFLRAQATVLLAAFVVAEMTLSFTGFGFAEPTPSWGTILRDTGSISTLSDYPWLLAPAGVMAILSWSLHTIGGSVPSAHEPGYWSRATASKLTPRDMPPTRTS
jgi:peptide/nickel transport system permease protein